MWVLLLGGLICKRQWGHLRGQSPHLVLIVLRSLRTREGQRLCFGDSDQRFICKVLVQLSVEAHLLQSFLPKPSLCPYLPTVWCSDSGESKKTGKTFINKKAITVLCLNWILWDTRSTFCLRDLMVLPLSMSVISARGIEHIQGAAHTDGFEHAHWVTHLRISLTWWAV